MNVSAQWREPNTALERPFFLSDSSRPGLGLSAPIVALMTIVLVALLWLPLKRALADVEVNYNEGWNTYRQEMAANGTPLYGLPPGHLTGETGYPPLSFHLVGLLRKVGIDCTAAGRWISLISLLTTGVFVSLIVRRVGGGITASLFSFLLYAIGIAILMPSRLGMNDPELLGGAFSAAGLYFYVRDPARYRFLCISAALFCLAGFTKQSFIAFPMAVSLDLVIRSRKAFTVWAGALLITAGLLTAAVILVDGHFFFLHLLVVRSYSIKAAWHNIIHPYLTTVQAPLLVAVGWSLCVFRSRRIFVLLFAFSHLIAFALAGAEGVDLNICFNAFAATAIICGLVLADVSVVQARLGLVTPSVGAALMAVLLAGILINVPGQLKDNADQNKTLHSREDDFRSATQFLKTHSGPALCDSLLLCHKSGKQYEFYSLFVRDQIRLNRMRDDEITQLLRAHYFRTVQLTIIPGESRDDDGMPIEESRHFTRTFMRELSRNYQVGMRTSQLLILVPKYEQ